MFLAMSGSQSQRSDGVASPQGQTGLLTAIQATHLRLIMQPSTACRSAVTDQADSVQ